MDPFSLAASVLQVAQSALVAAKLVERLIGLRKLPTEFRALLGEVVVLQDVILECVTLAARASGSTDAEARTMHLLNSHLARAQTKLEEICVIVSSNSAPRDQSLKDEMKIMWRGLVVGKAQILQFRDELVAIRLIVATLLGISTSYVQGCIMHETLVQPDLLRLTP